ncbi:MAG: sigma-70 family RNA polymerase sigma factor, partial [Planctomycetota bacterium]
MSVARHLARDQGDVEDLVQATFLAAIESAAAWDSKRRLMPWLLGVLVMRARKLRQERGRVLEPDRLQPPSSGTPEHAALDREVTEAVESAVGELPERYARILRLHLGQGLAPAELALELELEPGTARVQLHRGLKLLRAALPAGLAGGAALAMTGRGLANLRRAVLTEARRAAGPLAAAGTSVGAMGWLVPLTASKLATFGLAAATLVAVPWALWPGEQEREPLNAVAGVSPAPEPQAQLEPAPTARPTQEPDARVALAQEPEAPAKADRRAHIRGRFLLPGGAPAAGVALTLTTQRGQVSGSSQPRPSAPAPIESSSADDGSFELAFEALELASRALRAEPAHHASLRWNWSGLEAGSETDLGDVLLTGIGALEGRIVDRTGRTLTDGWRVRTSHTWALAGNARRPTNGYGRPDPASGSFRIERLPAGENSVRANHTSGAKIESRWVDVPELATAQVELLYDGPALDGAIVLRVGVRNGLTLELEAGAVRLLDAAGEVRLPTPVRGNSTRSRRYVFEDLSPGSYRAEVEDARFEPWSQDGVQPGQTLHATLEGRTGVQLTVLDDEGLPLERYALRVIYHRANTIPNDYRLVRAGETPPADGVLRGLQPGDLTLEVTVPDRPSARAVIEGLAAGEVRAVQVRVGRAQSLSGRLVGSDGVSPEADVRIELTRGERAGHDSQGTMVGVGGEIPRILNAVRSDAQGRFHFDELAGEPHTLRARWSRWLWLDRTVDVGQGSGEVVLAMPAAGWLEGELLLPAGRDAGGHEITLRCEAMERESFSYFGSTQFGGALLADGTFRFGPLPVGE